MRRATEPVPVIRVCVSRRPGAPAQPSGRKLRDLFGCAWRLARARRRSTGAVGHRLGVDVVFMDDAEIARLNKLHLGRVGPTDVLSFNIEERDRETGTFLLGEIAVSFQAASREAAVRGLAPAEELGRCAVHGLLHLMGFDHRTASQRRELERMQEAAVRQAFGPRAKRRSAANR